MRLEEVYEEAEIAGFKLPIPARIQARYFVVDCVICIWKCEEYVMLLLRVCVSVYLLNCR